MGSRVGRAYANGGRWGRNFKRQTHAKGIKTANNREAAEEMSDGGGEFPFTKPKLALDFEGVQCFY